MTEPRRWWCMADGWRLPGILSVPFEGVKCPKCRRIYSVRFNGVGGLTIEIKEPKLAVGKVSNEVKSG